MIPPLTDEEYELLVPAWAKELDHHSTRSPNHTLRCPLVPGLPVYNVLYGPKYGDERGIVVAVSTDGLGVHVNFGTGCSGSGVTYWVPDMETELGSKYVSWWRSSIAGHGWINIAPPLASGTRMTNPPCRCYDKKIGQSLSAVDSDGCPECAEFIRVVGQPAFDRCQTCGKTASRQPYEPPAVTDEVLDLDLLGKFASGQGGDRTGALMRAGLGEIVIDPFDDRCLGGNSYDVHLGETILFYETHGGKTPLDCAKPPQVVETRIHAGSMLLRPGMLYLGVTEEYTENHRYVPYLDGKSSIGRLGISIHATAGRGDVGFYGHWTCEITVVHPVIVYVGMPIGQLTFHTVRDDVERLYAEKPNSKYGSRGRQERPLPQASAMWRNFKEGA